MSEEPQPEISEIRSIAMLKMEKNFIAVINKGYPRQPYKSLSIRYLIGRAKEELHELEEAFDNGTLSEIKTECADVSNIIDYIFEAVCQLERERK